MAKIHDVAILGSGPSAFAAAAALAGRGRDVVVVCGDGPPVECPLADWAPKELFALPGLPKGLLKKSGAVAFRRIRYHSADLGRHVDYAARATAGHFLPAGRLTAATAAAARAAGARKLKAAGEPAVEVGEDYATIHAGPAVRARFVLMTQERPARAVKRLDFQARAQLSVSPRAVAVDVPLPAAARRKDPAALHILETADKHRTMLYFELPRSVHLRLLIRRPDGPVDASLLGEHIERLQAAGLLPESLPLGKARWAVWAPPAGAALEVVTHVARRSLLAGPAGGFADVVTAQTLMGGVASALLAAETLDRALDATNAPDVLSGFNAAWQKKLAAYLAPPRTPLALLLPLVFANRRILTRFSAAVLRGKDI
jgi:flavin-dependent dehydrogenase